MREFRAEFPFFARHPDVVYLDSAATTQRPRQVIAAVAEAMAGAANPGRGEHRLSVRALRSVESVREQVAAFLGARGPGEIAFTSGTTSSLDLVARAWAARRLRPGDAVALCFSDHAAAVEPWKLLADRLDLELRGYGISRVGSPARRSLAEACAGASVLALTHVHNVFGERNDVSALRELAGQDVVITLDAAQSAGTVPLNVRELGADFVSFSAHKIFGPPGVGVLWARNELIDEIGPLPGGRVRAATGLAARLEVGSLDVPGIAGLGAALSLFEHFDGQIAAEVHRLTLRLIDGLQEVPGIELLPGVAHTTCREGHGIVSLRLPAMDSADVALLLDEAGFAVRAGSHCLADANGVGDSVRISLHAYTDDGEVDRCVEALAEIAST